MKTEDFPVAKMWPKNDDAPTAFESGFDTGLSLNSENEALGACPGTQPHVPHLRSQGAGFPKGFHHQPILIRIIKIWVDECDIPLSNSATSPIQAITQLTTPSAKGSGPLDR